jgi:Xaa-Pro aminopeptidase
MYAELQQRLPARASLAGVNGLVEKLRMIKSEEEIEAIRASVRTNSRAFDRAVKRLKSSMTESELAAEIDFQMRKLGASTTAFETIVASGSRSALPHARPTHEALGANQLLLIDMGAMQAGYASDMTRMLHMGKPGARAKRLYSAVLEAQLAALAAVRAGVTCNGVDRAARRVLKSHGLEKQFVHSTGHGLGLEIHEAPRIGNKERMPLEAGMAITIEPGAYIQGFGGVRIEDTVLVTRTGCDVLTPTPKELLVV